MAALASVGELSEDENPDTASEKTGKGATKKRTRRHKSPILKRKQGSNASIAEAHQAKDTFASRTS